MPNRIAACLAVVMATVAVPASAQTQKPNYDRLKGVLEEKFSPKDEQPEPTRSLSAPPAAAAPGPELERAPAAGAAPGAGQPEASRSLEQAPLKAAKPQAVKNKDDYEWVKPDPDAIKKKLDKKDRPSTTGKPESWYDNFMNSMKGIWSSKPGASLSSPPDGFFAANAASLKPNTASEGERSFVQLAGGDGGSPAPSAAPVPVAKKNSYMLQLKPETSEAQIEELLKKYDLKVTKVIGALGVITVEPQHPEEATRGLDGEAPLESITDPKKKLERILEPKIIQDLRKDPSVDAAFVNSLIETKGLPKPSTAKAKKGEEIFGWRWQPGGEPDGNWGLKEIRMPSVWSIVDRHRKLNPGAARPKIGIIDVGFAENDTVKFNIARGSARPPLVRPDCESNHGTHVAGIIGASQTDKSGIDGIVPDANIDAIAIAAEFIGERERLDANEGWQAQAMLFSDVLSNAMFYLGDSMRAGDPLRVINVSLAYNFVARGVLGDAEPDTINGLKLHIAEQASVIRTMARLVETQVLFVVAAGNDSDGRADPLHTQWASPFAWAGTYAWTSGEPVKNIIVVEATDRSGKRAGFSNTGGHVSAPGVDIMSTIGSPTLPFAVCSGTSQAAPHVTALAALLFEINPKKTPEEIIALLKSAAKPAGEGTGAKRIDALQSVLGVSETTPLLLADLDADGKVETSDLKVFASHIASIERAATVEEKFTEDLNGDGVVDDNECFFPLIDLNGNGEGSARSPKQAGQAVERSDLEIIEASWQGNGEQLKLAMTETGLSAHVASSIVASSGDAASAAITKCLRKDALILAAVTPGPGTGTAAPGTAGETEATRGLEMAGGTAGTASSGTTAAATPADVRADTEKAIVELRKANPNLKVTINPATGMISSISGLKPDSAALAAGVSASKEQTDDDTRRMVESFLKTGALTAAMPTRNKKAQLDYKGRRKDPDFPGRYIANVEQSINGVPVFGSSAKLTVENSLGVTRFQGTTSSVAVDDTNPSVSKDDAIVSARLRLAQVIRGSPSSPPPPVQMGPNPETAEASAELTVFDPALSRTKIAGGARLAWIVAIDMYRVFVDAKTREVFHVFRDRPTGMIRRIYDLSGEKSELALVDESGKGRGSTLPPDAELAFRYTGMVRDFFFLVLGRNSFDDNDGDGPNGNAPLESYVRYGNVRNAFWCPSKSYDCPKANVMVFGPGYANAVDIVAHEMAHGIISHEADLVYSDEPGAVNESISDIFGALIEFYAKGGSGNWLIGEDAPGYSAERPLRSLAAPNLADATNASLFNKDANFSSTNRGQPDHYDDLLTPDSQMCASTWMNDNGCVHFNSGILNKFAYLISEGGEHRGTTVKGIGKTKLARLTYRTLTTALNQSSNLTNAAEGFLQSCLDFSSAKSAGFVTADCNEVIAAQQAVGLSAPGS